MNFQGKITIGKVQNRDIEDPIRIEIQDSVSGCRLLKLNMKLADFAEALTGLAHISCTGTFYEACPVNKIRELKEIDILRPSYTTDKEKLQKIVEPYEVDGWKCHGLDQLTNSHRWVGENKVKVAFIRFVEDKNE